MPTDGLGRETIDVLPPQCMMCTTPPKPMTLVKEQYDAWQRDTHIQFAFPEMSADDREMLMSGTHPACWETMWAESEEN